MTPWRVRILVVEDDKHLARAVKRGLEAEGFAVDVALDGDRRPWLATENAYDAMVLDIMLPGLAGYELCAELREAGDWTPILMLTAARRRGRGARPRHRRRRLPGQAVLLRRAAGPAARAAAPRRRRAAGRARGRRPAARPGRPPGLAGGHADRADPAPVRAAGVPDAAGRRGAVEDEILEHVWDFAFDGDPNIVEVYVRQLRQRIDEPFGRAGLQTVRLVGYRLDPDGG